MLKHSSKCHNSYYSNIIYKRKLPKRTINNNDNNMNVFEIIHPVILLLAVTHCRIEKFESKGRHHILFTPIRNLNTLFFKFDLAVFSVNSFGNTARRHLLTVCALVLATFHQISHLQRIVVFDHVSFCLQVVLKAST